MKKEWYSVIFVGMFLAAIGFTANANAETAPKTVTVSGKYYSLDRPGELFSINIDKTDPRHFLELILSIFMTKLEEQGQTVTLIKEPSLIRVPAPADYRLVFVDVPAVYEAPTGLSIEPPMPENPHAKTAAYSQMLISPWVKATLYYDAEGAILGGDLVLPVAQLMIIAELHYAAEDEWETLLNLPRDTADRMAIPPWAAGKTQLLYRAKQKELDRTRLSLSQIEDIFAPISEQAVWYARWVSISGFMETIYFKDCQKQAQPFYKNLYSALFEKLFVVPAPHGNAEDTAKEIDFTASDVEDLADASGDYNCFIRHFNPLSRKDWRWLFRTY